MSVTKKLEQIETLRKQLKEKDLLNKELGEKFVHTEQKVSYSYCSICSIVFNLLELMTISRNFVYQQQYCWFSLSEDFCSVSLLFSSLHVIALSWV